MEEAAAAADAYIKMPVQDFGMFEWKSLDDLIEIGYNSAGSGFGAILHPVVVPVLLALSAVKFALVAMFYMHLKQDSRLFSSVFVFPLIIAAVIILALIALFAYHYAFQKLIH